MSTKLNKNQLNERNTNEMNTEENAAQNIPRNILKNIPKNTEEEYVENIAESIILTGTSIQPPWCYFEGIFCGTFSGTLNLNYPSVLKISIPMKNLTGTIPGEIFNLQNLEFIDFSSNFLNGSIPGNLDMWSKKLVNLNFSMNFLTGTLPATLGQNTELQNLQLSNNRIYGQIPLSYTNLTNLEYLSIGTNALTGKIPNLLTNLKKLQLLNLELNSLSGTIPSKMSKLSLLSTLILQSNFLTMGIKKSINSTLFSTITNEGTLQLSENCLKFNSFYSTDQNCNATRCREPTSQPTSSEKKMYICIRLII